MLYGTLVLPSSSDQSDATYTVNLDGTSTTNFITSRSSPATVDTADIDILASFSGLQDGSHTLQVTFHNSDGGANGGNSTEGPLIAFDRAVVEVGAAVLK